MKLAKRTITQARSAIMSPNDYFMAHFVKNNYNLEYAVGSFKELMTAKLTLEMKKEGLINPCVDSPAFDRFRQVILYEKPEAPVPLIPEPEPQTTEPKP